MTQAEKHNEVLCSSIFWYCYCGFSILGLHLLLSMSQHFPNNNSLFKKKNAHKYRIKFKTIQNIILQKQ